MPEPGTATPLLDQYAKVKSQYPGHLVLFRVGDFYETFGDDAALLSRELDVVLTARAPDSRGDRTPMAGIPHHAVETYLGRLVRKGYKVALCDQVEDARFAKGLVRREVTRVVTPGTVVEDRILGGPDHSFLASLVLEGRAGTIGGFAAVDVTTGEWFHGPPDGPGVEGLVSALAAFQPREILYAGPEGSAASLLVALRHEFPLARLEPSPSASSASEVPTGLVGPSPPNGVTAPPFGEADLRLVSYLKLTQPRLLPSLNLADRGTAGRRLTLDAKTLRHLEITRPMNPEDPGGPTLLGTWDETVTAPGRRTLAFWLTNPLAEVVAIGERQDAVEALVARGPAVEELRAHLRAFADLARIAARVAGRRVRPHELRVLRSGLRALPGLVAYLAEGELPPALRRVRDDLEPPTALLRLLNDALPDETGPDEEPEVIFRVGHAPEIDRWRAAERAALGELAELERAEQESTGIRTLKVGYNQVFGYYFEVTRPNLGRVPPHFRRRQTVAGGERFVSDRLQELEHRVLEAREGARSAEAERWETFLGEVDPHVAAVQRVARAVGALDALATFARLAQTRRLVRPIVDDSSVFTVRDGRHPVLDRLLGESFVPNDTDLDRDERRLLVLTGPNMSGKSTYMRQLGLLVVLAQSGAFVPARYARIGLVTQLFTRMGFTDEIGRGKSSFMVEMTEVAEILRSADERSLVLLDEVGRGTSTFDGLAIAWATLRHLHDVTRARCVVATHYHQLTELVSGLAAADNAHLAVADRPEGVVFLHRLVPGATDRSYGIHVARLAGLPEEVLREADRLLRRLEVEGISGGAPKSRRGRGPRYTQAVLLPESGRTDALRDALRDLDLTHVTPEEAAAKLRELRSRPGPPTSGEERSR